MIGVFLDDQVPRGLIVAASTSYLRQRLGLPSRLSGSFAGLNNRPGLRPSASATAATTTALGLTRPVSIRWM